MNFPVSAIVGQKDQSLLAPVLQHLLNGVAFHTGALHGNALLHSLLERELDVQSPKDGVVLAALLSLSA